MTQKEIISIMERCSCGTRIEWIRSHDEAEHRGVVDTYCPQNGKEDAYLAVIEPGHFIPVLGAGEIEAIRILEEKKHGA